MTFTILAILEVASLVVLAVLLHGSVRAVYERDKLRKQTPLTLLSRYRVLYRRVAAVWGRYAVVALVLANAWWNSALHVFRRRGNVIVDERLRGSELVVPVSSGCNGRCCPLLLHA